MNISSTEPNSNSTAMKCCTRCSATKPLSGFYRSTGKKDGHESHCKECSKAAGKLKYQKNKDLVNQRSSERQKQNPERHRESVRQWRERNKEKLKAKDKAWRQANPEKVRLKAHNRRAKKRSVGGVLTLGVREKLFLLQKGKCACCAAPLGEDYHLDHIVPLALGGVNADENVQLLRATCNLKKSDRHPIDYMQSKGMLL